MTIEKFPSGEIKANFDIHDNYFAKPISLRTSDDIINLLLMVNAYRARFSINNNPICGISIAYFPYSRQDRVCNRGDSFSLKVICDLINSCGFRKVQVLEPHSQVLPSLLNNCVVIPMVNYLKDLPKTTIVVPDAGAEKRALEVAKMQGTELIVALKKRNTKTGEITDTVVYCDDLKGQDVTIIDDICDGGATFIKLAQKLKEKNCGQITLCVAHGLFTKGLDVFKGHIDHIYCIDNFKLVKKI